ncbi:TPA: DUF1282 domain-containing protein [Salmonella enterica]|nr:DUF1282 domain-containing protein [Salmonella enterica]
MNHVWGLFSHPDREMQVIKSENETVSHHYTHHVLLMAAIPVVCAFIGTTQIGWNFGDGNVLQLSLFTAFALAVLFYGVMLAGVAVMGRVIWWMARNYPQRPSLARCMVFAGYVATPLFLSGLMALYPLVWLCALVGAVALNTIKAVIRRDSEQASQLVQYLSTFFRKNLKRPSEIVTLADEIEHVNAYLQIEKARFQSRLQVQLDVPSTLSRQKLPAFTLQPIVENAIKHGTSQLLDTGNVAIRARREGQHLMLDIEDNAGLYQPSAGSSGLGMSLVDKRLREHFGDDYGISVACEPDCFTRITLRLPLEEDA